jgi:hypothetical protein
MLGCTGGANEYSDGTSVVQVHLLQSDDGEHWQPVVPGQPIVYPGGVSETDAAILDDGTSSSWAATR